MKEKEIIINDCAEEARDALRNDAPIVISLNESEIVSHIAEMAADELDEMIMDIDKPVAAAIVISLDESEAEDMFESLRMLFLIGGNKTMASCLEILKILERSDEEVYVRFKESFLATDLFDWWLEGVWLDELMEGGCKDVRS